MPVPKERKSDYLEYARNPDTWLFVARGELAVAQLLFEASKDLVTKPGIPVALSVGVHGAKYLHAGFALENATKAALVQRSPEMISEGGRLELRKLKVKTGHELSQLVVAVLGDLDEKTLKLTKKLEEHIIWAARYPTPIDGAKLYDRDIKTMLRMASSDEWRIVNDLFDRLVVLISDEAGGENRNESDKTRR